MSQNWIINIILSQELKRKLVILKSARLVYLSTVFEPYKIKSRILTLFKPSSSSRSRKHLVFWTLDWLIDYLYLQVTSHEDIIILTPRHAKGKYSININSHLQKIIGFNYLMNSTFFLLFYLIIYLQNKTNKKRESVNSLVPMSTLKKNIF